jgi:hypothetical protein
MQQPRPRHRFCGALPLALVAWLLAAGAAPAQSKIDVTTHHYDNLRTGWNANETILSTGTVSQTSFRLLKKVAVDEQIDAQPLIAADVSFGGKLGTHDVVYVATEHNSLYGFDADTGEKLVHRNFGTPLSRLHLPGFCNNNSDFVGIASTPVIDANAGTMYVMVDTFEKGKPVYRLHGVSLTTLADVVNPIVVTATHSYIDGDQFTFSAAASRQRSALLLSNGTVYAAFGSYCDDDRSISAGLLLGWTPGPDGFTPLASNELVDLQDETKNGDMALSSIWMSGMGPAADADGNIFFVTGNTGAGNYNNAAGAVGVNLAESIVAVSPDLATTEGFFTPQNELTLDENDTDFGSGGITLLPDQPGSAPHLAVAAGKDGNLYFVNRDSLGGFTSGGPDNVLQTVPLAGSCWCGESFFVGSDGVSRVVGSGGNQIQVWTLDTSSSPTLSLEHVSRGLAQGHPGGVFTTVSSNGQAPGAIIWAVGRPVRGGTHALRLYAFDALNADPDGQLTMLFSETAGNWLHANSAANAVPVVANGKVYVAAYKRLSIFGLNPPGQTPKAAAVEEEEASAPEEEPEEPPYNRLYGTLTGVAGTAMTVRSRTGTVAVDASAALASQQAGVPVVGTAVLVYGFYDKTGVLHAVAMQRAQPSPEDWDTDR